MQEEITQTAVLYFIDKLLLCIYKQVPSMMVSMHICFSVCTKRLSSCNSEQRRWSTLEKEGYAIILCITEVWYLTSQCPLTLENLIYINDTTSLKVVREIWRCNNSNSILNVLHMLWKLLTMGSLEFVNFQFERRKNQKMFRTIVLITSWVF